MLNTDIIMLGWLRSPAEVGYYSAAQKIIYLLYVLPTLIATSMFPIMAKMAKINPNFVKIMLERAVMIMLMVAVPLSVLGILFAPAIIQLFFGVEYLPAILTFQILMATIIIIYPSSLISNAIFAYDHQKSFIVFVAIAAIGNIVFNFLFIPIYGIEGAAIATIFVQLITNGLIWAKMKKINGFNIWPQLRKYLGTK